MDDMIKCDGLTRGIRPEIPSFANEVPTVSSGHDLHQPRLVRDEAHYPGTHNICFVNASVQLLSVSGIATFLSTELQEFLSNDDPQDYSVSRALASLFSDQEDGVQSTASLMR